MFLRPKISVCTGVIHIYIYMYKSAYNAKFKIELVTWILYYLLMLLCPDMSAVGKTAAVTLALVNAVKAKQWMFSIELSVDYF